MLSEIKVIMKANLTPGLCTNKYEDWFPITNQKELEEIEEELNENTTQAMVMYY